MSGIQTYCRHQLVIRIPCLGMKSVVIFRSAIETPRVYIGLITHGKVVGGGGDVVCHPGALVMADFRLPISDL